MISVGNPLVYLFSASLTVPFRKGSKCIILAKRYDFPPRSSHDMHNGAQVYCKSQNMRCLTDSHKSNRGYFRDARTKQQMIRGKKRAGKIFTPSIL